MTTSVFVGVHRDASRGRRRLPRARVESSPRREPRLESLNFVFAGALLGVTLLLTGCGVVGWQYRYGGQQYTMTRPNIEYHEHAIKDVEADAPRRMPELDADEAHRACALGAACRLEVHRVVSS